LIVDGKRPTSEEAAIDQVVAASRIAASAGYEDLTLGHVSVRGPDGSSMYIKRKGMSLGEVRSSDVVRIDLNDADALTAPTMHLEAIMHVEAYRARPDVGCVIHGHPLYATALGATDARLVLVSHDGVLFHEGVGLYDDSADLITTSEQGRKVADALGQRRAVLLKNHGVMVVGEDVRWTMLGALTLERALKLQVIANALGEIDAISEDQASAMFYDKYQDHFLDEYWENWTRVLS
jgi:ribulose-5-phosphate 4-epimerase/fuculose-1-phosphate aldolase